MEITSTPTATSPAATPSKASGSIISSDFETFLKMLTAQAKYQDPLEPLDSTEYASQLATFSSVEQQVKSNDLLAGIAANLGAGNMAQFAGWIGMDARSTAPTHFDGSPISLTPKPASVADETWLVVRDGDGTQVQRLKIPVSDDPVEWAGVDDNGTPFPQGVYSFALESHAEGAVVSTDAIETYSRITEARNDNGQTVLVLRGGSTVSSTDITALRSDG